VPELVEGTDFEHAEATKRKKTADTAGRMSQTLSTSKVLSVFLSDLTGLSIRILKP